MKRAYFVGSLPYLPAYDRMIRHTSVCSQCASVLKPNTGSGQYEDLCPDGQSLDSALKEVVTWTKERARLN